MNLLNMYSLNLSQLMDDSPPWNMLPCFVKQGNVASMAEALSDGACPTCAINELHHNPEGLYGLLDATNLLSDDLCERNQAIVWAICNRFRGPHWQMFALWDHEDRVRRARVASQLRKDAAELALLEIAELCN